jgi:ribonuclease HI
MPSKFNSSKSSYSPNKSSQSSPPLRVQLRKEAWRLGKTVGKVAWHWAKNQEPVKRRLDQFEEKLEETKTKARTKLHTLEQEFWAWVESLEAEGYIESPHCVGPSLAICYERLGVDSQVSNEALRKAWRKKMMSCHPDRFAQDPMALAQAEERAREINEAYQRIQKSRGL